MRESDDNRVRKKPSAKETTAKIQARTGHLPGVRIAVMGPPDSNEFKRDACDADVALLALIHHR